MWRWWIINKFSTRFNELIKEKKINQIDIVKGTNIPASSINDYVSGKYFPKRENLLKIAVFLDVNPDWLSGDLDDRNNISEYIISNYSKNTDTLYYYFLEKILSNAPDVLANFLINNKKQIDIIMKNEKEGE